MKKNVNDVKIYGYVYQVSNLEMKVSGENSKNPGTPFIMGDIEIATDESGINVVPVHFTYVTEHYKKKDANGNPMENRTYTILKKIIETPELTWIKGGKENAMTVRIDGSLDVNDYYNRDNQQVSMKRVSGSFITVIKDAELAEIDSRAVFKVDALIDKVTRVEEDPEKGIDEHGIVSGYVFNYANALLPFEFKVTNPAGITYFEDKDPSSSEPLYTMLTGDIINKVTREKKVEEAAFGDDIVSYVNHRERTWLIKNAKNVPYEFDDESTITREELKKALQDREIHWADIKKNREEYQSKNKTVETGAFDAAAAPVQNKTFNF